MLPSQSGIPLPLDSVDGCTQNPKVGGSNSTPRNQKSLFFQQLPRTLQPSEFVVFVVEGSRTLRRSSEFGSQHMLPLIKRRIISGLPVIREESEYREKSARRAAGHEAAIVSLRLLLAPERGAYKRIYAEVASNARHWASRDATSSGVRIITDRSHDTCSSRALPSLPPVFAPSV
jgi:hypothetical protein